MNSLYLGEKEYFKAKIKGYRIRKLPWSKKVIGTDSNCVKGVRLKTTEGGGPLRIWDGGLCPLDNIGRRVGRVVDYKL